MGFRNAPKLASLLVAALLSASANAQTLARKGWVGSGITVEAWWQGAELYQIDPLSFQHTNDDGFGDLRGIVQRLDYLQTLNVDAIVLSPFQLQPEFGKTASSAPFAPKYGSEEDLDRLVQEASQRKMRIFVDLPLDGSRTMQQVEGEARFWLSRGIAGLRLTSLEDNATPLSAAQIADRVRQLQRVCASYAGQRVLFWDMQQPVAAAPAPRASSRHRSGTIAPANTPELTIDRRLAAMARMDAASLRGALTVGPNAGMPVPATDGTNLPRSFDRYGDGANDIAIAKVLATALLTSGGAPLLYFGQEIGIAVDPANVALQDADADSLLNWYRRMSALHHENGALHSGSMAMIAETNPDIVAWVRQPSALSTSPPVVVVCNVTARTLLVSVSADIRRLGIQTGTGMMRTLASTTLSASSASIGASAKQPESGPVSMNGIALPPFGVYIGELPRQPGLESAPAAVRHTSRGSRRSP
jgi:hypothetical protein